MSKVKELGSETIDTIMTKEKALPGETLIDITDMTEEIEMKE